MEEDSSSSLQSDMFTICTHLLSYIFFRSENIYLASSIYSALNSNLRTDSFDAEASACAYTVSCCIEVELCSVYVCTSTRNHVHYYIVCRMYAGAPRPFGFNLRRSEA